MPLAFEDILTRLEEQKTEFLSKIERWPPEILSHRLTPADWSALEVLDHLVKTEVGILSRARSGLASPHAIGLNDRLRTIFIQKIFASDRKVKVPASARQVLPGTALHLEEIRERWRDSREELKSFVRGSNSELLSEGIYRHPVGGWMGMKQILEFFSVHLIHHHYQLDRIAGSAALEETIK